MKNLLSFEKFNESFVPKRVEGREDDAIKRGISIKNYLKLAQSGLLKTLDWKFDSIGAKNADFDINSDSRISLYNAYYEPNNDDLTIGFSIQYDDYLENPKKGKYQIQISDSQGENFYEQFNSFEEGMLKLEEYIGQKPKFIGKKNSKVNESFWTSYIGHKTEDKNGTSYLNVGGVPGSWENRDVFINPLGEALIETKGEVTEEIVSKAVKLLKKIESNRNLNADLKRDPDDFWLEKHWEKYAEKNGLTPWQTRNKDYADEAYEYPSAFWLVRWLCLNVGKKLKRLDYGEGYFSY